MDRRTIETLASGAGVVMACCAAALFIPATRGRILELAEDQLRDFDETQAKRVVYRGGAQTMSAVMVEAKKQGSSIVQELGRMLKKRMGAEQSSGSRVGETSTST